VHLVSGMMFMLGLNEPPKRVLSTGGILRWKDGRNMPDVHATLFEYGDIPIYFRLNLGTESPEIYRFNAPRAFSKSPNSLSPTIRKPARTKSPSYYSSGFPRAMREEYVNKWHQEHDPAPGKEPGLQGFTFRSVSWDEEKPHLWTYFQSRAHPPAQRRRRSLRPQRRASLPSGQRILLPQSRHRLGRRKKSKPNRGTANLCPSHANFARSYLAQSWKPWPAGCSKLSAKVSRPRALAHPPFAAPQTRSHAWPRAPHM